MPRGLERMQPVASVGVHWLLSASYASVHACRHLRQCMQTPPSMVTHSLITDSMHMHVKGHAAVNPTCCEAWQACQRSTAYQTIRLHGPGHWLLFPVCLHSPSAVVTAAACLFSPPSLHPLIPSSQHSSLLPLPPITLSAHCVAGRQAPSGDPDLLCHCLARIASQLQSSLLLTIHTWLV